MKKLILKFNNRTGRDLLPKVLAMSKELGLEVQKVEEHKLSGSTTLHKVIHIGGESLKLCELDKRLVRFASISRKAA